MIIPVPVGTRTETTVEGAVGTAFDCPSCRYRAHAVVHARGTATQVHALGIRGADADERGRAEAERSMRMDAYALVDLLPCPSCGRVNAYARRRALLRPVRIGALVVVIASLFVWGMFAALHADPSWRMPLIDGVLAAVVGAAAYFDYKARLRLAASTIRLEAGAVVEKRPQVVGSACKQCTQKISFAIDGVACGSCGAPLHTRCESAHVCST